MNRLLSLGIILSVLLVFLGIPAFCYADRVAALLDGSGVDAVSSASLELPEQPSGAFVVLLNAARHPDTLDVWTAFFLEQDVGVIFEDLNCIVIDSDAAGIQLAERYQARLAENQMTVVRENGLLAVSRAQWGVYDVLIVSGEIADAYTLSTVYGSPEAYRIDVRGGAA